jgi:hypothetical protein
MNGVLHDVVLRAIGPALDLLPPGMDTPKARVMLLAIGLQESRFQYRRQVSGPAKGFWQFEGGRYSATTEVFQNTKVSAFCERLCIARKVSHSVPAIHAAIENDDVLAAGMARLRLWCAPGALPSVDDPNGAWGYYLNTWLPGKPHRETWDKFHAAARDEVVGDAA